MVAMLGRLLSRFGTAEFNVEVLTMYEAHLDPVLGKRFEKTWLKAMRFESY